MIDFGVLDFIVTACKRYTSDSTPELLRHAALALANLAIYSDGECYQKIIAKNVRFF
jgi:hypothetical protein